MNDLTIYIPENLAPLRYASRLLAAQGCTVTQEPIPGITHVLLGVPTGNAAPDLRVLPEQATIFGGNLDHPSFAERKKVDLLKDPTYLAKNAAITAHCAIRIAAEKLPIVWPDTAVLVLGWGRIGKCLAQILKALGADITIAARKPEDRALLLALGYQVLDTGALTPELHRFRVIFNTAPHMVIPDSEAIYCRPDCMKIDLASVPGIGGSGVIWARGLPGKMAPESSGRLIAETVFRRIKED